MAAHIGRTRADGCHSRSAHHPLALLLGALHESARRHVVTGNRYSTVGMRPPRRRSMRNLRAGMAVGLLFAAFPAWAAGASPPAKAPLLDLPIFVYVLAYHE